MNTRSPARWLAALTTAGALMGAGGCGVEPADSDEVLLARRIVAFSADGAAGQEVPSDSGEAEVPSEADGPATEVMRRKLDDAIAILTSARIVALVQAPDRDTAYLSDTDPSSAGTTQVLADNFSFVQPVRITGVRWWGTYAFGPIPPVDHFRIRFHQNADGFPGPIVYEEDLGFQNAGRTATGRTLNVGTAEFAYQTDLQTGFQAQPGNTYWLTVINDTSGSPASWGWESGDGGDNQLAFSQDGGNLWDIAPTDAAFELLTNQPSVISEGVVKAAVRQGMESLFMSNLVVLPTAGVPDAGMLFDGFLGMSEEFVTALSSYIAASGPERGSSSAAAFEARNFIQVFREAAEVVGQSTGVCRPDDLDAPECEPLRDDDEGGDIIDPVLDPCLCDLDCDGDVDREDCQIFVACGTGPAVRYDQGNVPPTCPLFPDPLGYIAADLDLDLDVDSRDYAILQRAFSGSNQPSTRCEAASTAARQAARLRFSREVRSPFFVGLPTPTIQEQVIITPESVQPGDCVVVTKEIQGVKAVIRPVLIPIWVEPWFARATIVGYQTVWVWEFIPAEFLKTINYCNVAGTGLTTDVSIKIVLERQLLHFWSFLKKDVSLHGDNE